MTTIARVGVEDDTDAGDRRLPFARAADVDGWLFVSGRTPTMDDEVVDNGIVEQSHQTVKNVLTILAEASYGPEHIVHCDAWLDDPHDFQSFSKVFKEYFGASPPAHTCVVSSMAINCKVEVDCMAYKKP